jgi:hypothetical protein
MSFASPGFLISRAIGTSSLTAGIFTLAKLLQVEG